MKEMKTGVGGADYTADSWADLKIEMLEGEYG